VAKGFSHFIMSAGIKRIFCNLQIFSNGSRLPVSISDSVGFFLACDGVIGANSLFPEMCYIQGTPW
jgi:hypothetical protein